MVFPPGMGFALGLGGGGAINAPTDIALTSTSTNDGLAIGATIGVFSATDADVGETFTFELIADTSELFDVSGTNLISTGLLTVGSHTIVARVTDSSGATYDETFVITVASANLAPTDIALTPISALTDPNWARVALMLGMDGANGSTTVTDESSYAHTMTTIGSLTTSLFKFGTASLNVLGAGYTRTPSASELQYGSNDFTVEAWVYPSAGGAGFLRT